MRMIVKIGRWILVTAGIVVLTTFSIDATDTLRGSQSALSIFARNVSEEVCPTGMVPVDLASGTLCVDVYENSVGDNCVHGTPQSDLDTKANIDTYDCRSASVAGAVPWTYVAYHQAKSLCAKRGTRLPTPLEWYEAALGTPDVGTCNLEGALAAGGTYDACVSSRGMYDMVGNVWEWVDGEVVTGVYNERAVPNEGYVQAVDAAGVALATAPTSSALYSDDYMWTELSGTYGLMRGGFYGSESDGGIYSVQARVAHAFSSSATGFRCVKDI